MSVKVPGKPVRSRANPFIDKPELLTDPVFLIGNGKSRLSFDLERLRPYGTIIGCNALYRDFEPDVLIAIDAKMLTEIKDSGYEGYCIIPSNRSVRVPTAKLFKAEKFNTSGSFALQLISRTMNPKLCFMIGMDSYPGNVYDNTKNYQTNTLQNFTGVGNYYLQALQLKNQGETVFVNVNDRDAWPKAVHDTGRYKCISFAAFEKVLEAMK